MTVFTRSMLLFLIISPCICLLLYTFLLWHAMYRADYTVARCPSACLCVTRQYSVETAKHIIRLFSSSGSDTILVFCIKWYDNIPMVPPPHPQRECQMQEWHEKIAIFSQHLTSSQK